ncbi:zinc ribbon domain-containing protein [Aquisalibacillus elongatus]|uniref:Double zinc ribbon protein n=1 Tax=Aquisalibacillus elongatus TaxID=485577 RepID=A0A3N5BQT6_9BACI|nr:zinc ribbon domain-containing protein [Aquisalibacillus elongatus]RPF52138.1 double zinc ribbon protein [Aquisalibacillus elongatus]
MNEYVNQEIERLKREKSKLLAKLGQSIYYQYRIGQFYSEELTEFEEKISSLDAEMYELKSKLNRDDLQFRCSCGHAIDLNDTYCSRCGKKIESVKEEETSYCRACGTEMALHSNFCHVCGSRHNQKQGVST